MQEKQVLQNALLHFKQETGMTIREVPHPSKKPPSNFQPDTYVDIQNNGKDYHFWVDIKNELRQIHIPGLIDRFGQNPENCLLICQYLSKPNRSLLKERGINYLDVSGNCHIKKGALMLFINDKTVTQQREPDAGKLWKPAGLRLVFALLQNPNLLNESYRNIAAESKVSLGMVGALVREMEKEEYIKKFKDKAIIENREALLNRWTETYYTVMRAKLVQGKFRFATPNDREIWKNRMLKQAWWGGEPAGAILTKFLHPEKFTIYSDLQKTEVMKQLHVVPDANGEVELLKPFWNTELIHKDKQQTVPPLLAFAELNTSLDSRNREIAKRIKEKYNV